MIRPLLTEVLLFLAPFAVYAAYLLATRSGLLDAASWSPRILIWLTALAFVLMIGGLYQLTQENAHPAGSSYVPPHMENGKLIPGQFK